MSTPSENTKESEQPKQSPPPSSRTRSSRNPEPVRTLSEKEREKQALKEISRNKDGKPLSSKSDKLQTAAPTRAASKSLKAPQLPDIGESEPGMREFHSVVVRFRLLIVGSIWLQVVGDHCQFPSLRTLRSRRCSQESNRSSFCRSQ